MMMMTELMRSGLLGNEKEKTGGEEEGMIEDGVVGEVSADS